MKELFLELTKSLKDIVLQRTLGIRLEERPPLEDWPQSVAIYREYLFQEEPRKVSPGVVLQR